LVSNDKRSVKNACLTTNLTNKINLIATLDTAHMPNKCTCSGQFSADIICKNICNDPQPKYSHKQKLFDRYFLHLFTKNIYQSTNMNFDDATRITRTEASNNVPQNTIKNKALKD